MCLTFEGKFTEDAEHKENADGRWRAVSLEIPMRNSRLPLNLGVLGALRVLRGIAFLAS